MAERQVSAGRQTFTLPELFMVMATQNLSSKRVYALPEAQLDRFLLHVRVDYPDRQPKLISCAWFAARLPV